MTESQKPPTICDGAEVAAREYRRAKHLEFAEAIYKHAFDESKLSDDEIKRKRDQIPRLGIVPFNAGFDAGVTYEREQSKVLIEALKYYADRHNWERIEGHTAWASNLNNQDCAMLNCGGGRARLALAKYRGE